MAMVRAATGSALHILFFMAPPCHGLATPFTNLARVVACMQWQNVRRLIEEGTVAHVGKRRYALRAFPGVVHIPHATKGEASLHASPCLVPVAAGPAYCLAQPLPFV